MQNDTLIFPETISGRIYPEKPILDINNFSVVKYRCEKFFLADCIMEERIR
ncbi:MAG: hypothetical protein HFI52_04910 [Lachnospiraceae bacterium]|nr:hypothetical protein [Lachnospiraceae bacterium]